MSELRPDLPSSKRIYCNKCRTETNHTVKCDHTRRDNVEENGKIVSWEEHVYRFWICAGCENATLEECVTVDEFITADGTQIYDSAFIPKRPGYEIGEKHFIRLPQKLSRIYRESIQAFNNELHVLCAAGLRTLIEGICDNKKIKGKNLEDRINGLVGYLPQNIVANLHGFRFMGNEALHKMTAPKPEDLRLAIEVSEDLLNYLYELDYKVTRLTAKVGNKAKGGG